MSDTLVTPDGCALHWRDFTADGPAGAAPRAQVLIVHGLGEHSGRYAHVARHLAAAGCAVAAYDQRGHGRSAGPRGVIPAAHSLLADLGTAIAHLRARRPGLPLVLLGHSMGGLVVGRYVAEGLAEAPAAWWQPVDALVMSSPALDVDMNPVQRLLLALLGGLAPRLAVANGLKPEWVCRDPAVVRAYVADPLVHDRIAAGLARFMVDAGALVRQRAAAWRTPTGLFYAGADRCVPPRGSAQFAAAAPPGVVASTRYEGLSHEIFNEPEQARVLADLTAWLDTALPVAGRQAAA